MNAVHIRKLFGDKKPTQGKPMNKRNNLKRPKSVAKISGEFHGTFASSGAGSRPSATGGVQPARPVRTSRTTYSALWESDKCITIERGSEPGSKEKARTTQGSVAGCQETQLELNKKNISEKPSLWRMKIKISQLARLIVGCNSDVPKNKFVQNM